MWAWGRQHLRVWRWAALATLAASVTHAQPLPPQPPHPTLHRPPLHRAPVHHPPPHPAPHRPAPAPHPPPPALAASPPAPAVEPPADKGSVTGFPLPRFASLRTGEVNLRAGPGTRYPIEWVYQRRDLPIEIEREFEVWRLVRLEDGTRGWLQQATIWGRRTFVVAGNQHAIRSEAKDTASVLARLDPGVVGRITRCDAGSDWCRVEVQAYKGWMKRADFWGTLPGEAVQ